MLGTLDNQEIIEVLQQGFLGRIGFLDNGKVHILPVTYLYDNGAIICHSFEGRKLTAMREQPEVCFEVEAIEDAQNWQCVVAHGHFEILDDAEQLALAHKRLPKLGLEKKAKLSTAPPSEQNAGLQTSAKVAPVFYRIKLHELSGRFEKTITD